MLIYHRYWRRFLRYRKKLARIVRRITIKPAMKLWYASAVTLTRDRNVLAHMHKRIARRVKRSVMQQWKALSARSAHLKLLADEVRRRVTLLRKQSLLFKWMRRIDNKINDEKCEQVQALAQWGLLKRCMFHWHKHALISELCTWKSTKAAVRNWYLSAYIRQKLRASFVRSERYYEAYKAQICLYGWHRRTARKLRLQNRHHKAMRLKDLRKYLVHFRKWKRRMYLVYRARMFLSALQRSPRLFNMHRSIHRWRR